jgi:hypothetical protein
VNAARMSVRDTHGFLQKLRFLSMLLLEVLELSRPATQHGLQPILNDTAD